MSRMRRGWELTKKSWSLLREHRSLAQFPLYAGLSALVAIVVTVLPGIYLIDAKASTVGGIVLVALGLYLASFVGIFFGVGLAATADQIFHGREASIGDGLGVARGRIGAIAGWAAISALVGVIFVALENVSEIGAQIAGYVLDAAWSLITFMAIPVIAIEGTGPFATIKRSTSLFRTRWAGQVTGNVAIGGLVGLLGVVPGILLVILGIVLWSSNGNGTGIAVGAVVALVGIALFVVSVLVMKALQGIFGVALYRFAADGEATGGFSAAELESVAKTRRS
jgi:hypothetical protein